MRRADSTFYINLRQTDVGSASASSNPLIQTKHNDWASNQTCFLGGKRPMRDGGGAPAFISWFPLAIYNTAHRKIFLRHPRDMVLSCVLSLFVDHIFSLELISCKHWRSPSAAFQSPVILGNWSHTDSAAKRQEQKLVAARYGALWRPVSPASLALRLAVQDTLHIHFSDHLQALAFSRLTNSIHWMPTVAAIRS